MKGERLGKQLEVGTTYVAHPQAHRSSRLIEVDKLQPGIIESRRIPILVKPRQVRGFD